MQYAKGHKFYGPDGKGYELTRDWNNHETPTSFHFKEFGGAEKPVTGGIMPEWLIAQIRPKTDDK